MEEDFTHESNIDLNFETALKYLRSGKKMSRKGFGNDIMFLAHMPPIL